MYFSQYANVDKVLEFIKPKVTALLKESKYGISIDIKKNQKTRTTKQNDYMWAVYKNIVSFYEKTGFIPDELKVNRISKEFLHYYFKARFDVVETKKLSTTEFCEYIDKIQLLMNEQTKGEYEPIYPDEPFDV
jgi:DNA-binding transcriptional regulator WhiA